MAHHEHHGGPTHPYHLVNPSPWPLVGSLSLMTLAIGAALAFHKHQIGFVVLLLGFAMSLYTMYGWWRDVVKESVVDKAHTAPVSHGLRVGMVLFIVSELLFFAAFFWSFFNASTLPKLPVTQDDIWAIAQGIWPPAGIVPFDPFHLPFLNTLILLLSGTTVTWAHWCILQNDQKGTIQALWYTVILGVIFTFLQAYEYSHAAFGFKDGVYATNFYLATGFHGFHVLVGTIFLAVCLMRSYKGHFSPQKHLGFEFAAWYWHFVDVVWLFLFIFIYIDFANKPGVLNAAMWMAILTMVGMLVAAVVFGMRFVKSGGFAKIASHH